MHPTYSLEAATALVEVRISSLRRRSKLEKVYLSSDSSQEPVTTTRKRYLDAWSGETQDGRPVHISYHLGELIITIDFLVPSRNGRLMSYPLTVLRWKPKVAEAMIKSLKAIKASKPKSFNASDLSKLKQSIQIESDFRERQEMRAQNGKHRLVSKRQLTNWLFTHNKHFDTLRSLNMAGGKVRFRIESFRSHGLSL